MIASRRFFAIACSSALVLACSRAPHGDAAPGPEPVRGDASASDPRVAAVPGDAGASADGAPKGDVQSTTLAPGDPVKSKSIGHTSYVLKLTMTSGAQAVFKPRSRLPLGDRRYRGEIAASRLARALGLVNVPRAEPRAFDAAALRALQPDFDAKALPDADGHIRGAITAWIPGYEVLPLEQPSARAGWEPWLTDASKPVPFDQRSLAKDLSVLVAFDYVTGNWDRWSGGNVAKDGRAGTVLFPDNDGAFYDPPPADSLARQLALLRRVTRFSRAFVALLRSLDEPKLTGIFGDETPGQPLLPARVVHDVDQRRRTVVALVDARLADAGEGTTFDFP